MCLRKLGAFISFVWSSVTKCQRQVAYKEQQFIAHSSEAGSPR